MKQPLIKVHHGARRTFVKAYHGPGYPTDPDTKFKLSFWSPSPNYQAGDTVLFNGQEAIITHVGLPTATLAELWPEEFVEVAQMAHYLYRSGLLMDSLRRNHHRVHVHRKRFWLSLTPKRSSMQYDNAQMDPKDEMLSVPAFAAGTIYEPPDGGDDKVFVAAFVTMDKDEASKVAEGMNRQEDDTPVAFSKWTVREITASQFRRYRSELQTQASFELIARTYRGDT